MSLNQLTGPIPSEFGNLPFLFWLWLDENDLSGPIPSELGKLTLLEIPLLNSDRLHGGVPPENSNLQNVKIMYTENNGLTGGVDNRFCDRKAAVDAFWADCNVICDCCIYCCPLGPEGRPGSCV